MTLSSSPRARVKHTLQARVGLLNVVMVLAILAFLLSSANRVQGSALADINEQESIATIATPMVWDTQSVNSQRMFYNMGDHSLRLDSAGNEHVAFGGDHLYYASYDGTNWVGETVDAADNVGMYASLFMDSSDHPHISYYDAHYGSLKYARNLGSGWEIYSIDHWSWGLEGLVDQTVLPPDQVALDAYASPRIWQADPLETDAYVNPDADPEILADTNGVGLFTSIVLDTNGNPYISYYDALNGNLKCARRQLGNWYVDSVDKTDVTGKYSSIAVNDETPIKIYISYYDSTNGDLRYAVWNGAKWSRTTADSTGDVGQYTSIALDNNDYARISYYDATNGDLKYASWNGTKFTLSKVDGTGNDVGMYTSIALHNQRQPHISYYDKTHGTLRYAAYGSTGWTIYTLSTDEMAGMYSSLVLDPNKNWYPSVTYYVAVGGFLKMVEKTGSTTWKHTLIDQAHDQGAHTSMDLDSAQNPHIIYVDDTVDVLDYAYWDGAAWHTEVIDDDEPAGLYGSLILDSANTPHVSYWDMKNNRLRYATRVGGVWQREYADPKTGVGTYTSIGLDPSGLPYISYYDAQDKDLRLTHKLANGTWEVLVVDSSYNVGKYSSLVVDGAGMPHISYYNETNGKLIYSSFQGGDWVKQVVGQVGIAGLLTSLTLDSFGNPHIAYVREDNDTVMYASYTGSEWILQTIDQTGSRDSFNLSLALDSSNNPFISYVRSTNLQVAHWTGSEWHWQTVDSSGDVGRFSSIKILNSGYPVVAYYDATNGDLKYAAAKYAYLTFLPDLNR